MRKFTNLNKTWTFTGPKGTKEQVDVPHTWNNIDGQDGGNDYWRGSCTYEKTFSAPEFDPETELVYLQFQGVNASCEVSLNGKDVCSHDGGSYDLNYRPSMWSAIGGKEKAQEVNKEIAKYVDVMIGNEEDFTACLGFEIEGNDENLKELNLEGYKKMINKAAETYPNFKVVATTLREVKTATVNDWSAICWADGEIYKAKDYKGLEIMDRVGGGDSFASGLVYGLMTTENAELAVNYGAAHGALAMTTPGDTTMASKKEVEAIMGGAGARVQR